jgi:hypothetical protein
MECKLVHKDLEDIFFRTGVWKMSVYHCINTSWVKSSADLIEFRIIFLPVCLLSKNLKIKIYRTNFTCGFVGM